MAAIAVSLCTGTLDRNKKFRLQKAEIVGGVIFRHSLKSAIRWTEIFGKPVFQVSVLVPKFSVRFILKTQMVSQGKDL